MTSDLLPELGSPPTTSPFHSPTSKTNTHGPGETFMSTGFILEGFPSMGRASYALGTERKPTRLRFDSDPRATRRLPSTTGPTPARPVSRYALHASGKSVTRFPEEFSGKTDLDGRRLLRPNERHLSNTPETPS